MNAGRVFAVGESLIDIVQTAVGSIEFPGGSPMNVACGLARLGIPTTLRTSIGPDDRGRKLTQHISSSGASVDEKSFNAAATSTAKATLDPAGKADYEFDITWAPGEIVAPADVAAVHAGSIGATLAPGADDVLDFFIEVTPGILRTFDPNVRPGVTPDRPSVLRLVQGFASYADVVKMSDEDAAWLHPGRRLEEVVDHYLTCGSRMVAITRGSEGCLVASPSAMLSLPSPAVQVVDTIGAGDAFMSGMIFAILNSGYTSRLQASELHGVDLRIIASTALKAAQITVARAGANPPTIRELQTL